MVSEKVNPTAQKENNVYIFGAHSRAQTLKEYFSILHPDWQVRAFLVDNDEPNPIRAGGTPVMHLPVDPNELDTSAAVYLAIRGVHHPDVSASLAECGFSEIIPVTPELDIELRNAYLKIVMPQAGRTFIKIDDLPPGKKEKKSSGASRVYVIKSVYDKSLHTPYEMQPYEAYLQVGAARTDGRIEENGLTDHTGENISDRNRQFCEITGLYWMWKHAPEVWIGLAHYRRHFLLPDDWQLRMEAADADVLLPTPLFVSPSLEENYKSRHTADAFDAMMTYIRKQLPEEADDIQDFFRQNLYSPCNMFIMRREVLDAYCAWVFPILFAVADMIGEKEDAYQNRYPAFLPERLLPCYFLIHRNEYQTIYADKNFLA